MSDKKKTKRRLFIALWPNDELRIGIARVQQQIIDANLDNAVRKVLTANFHMTLHFLGMVERDTESCLRAAMEKCHEKSFHITLARQGYFKKARVSWLGPDSCLPELSALVASQSAIIQSCGLTTSESFTPHVTLCRKGHEPAMVSFEALQWHVQDFVLVESLSVPGGVKYRVIDRWELH